MTMTHATIDGNGLVLHLFNPMLMGTALSDNTVPAPPNDPAPGWQWRYDAEQGWQEIEDKRGRTYCDPQDPTARLVITKLLQEPPQGWVLQGPEHRLLERKAARWVIIKAARGAAEFGGVVWDGSVFDSNPISQSRIQGAALLAASNPSMTFDWTLADNTVRVLSAADVQELALALAQHVSDVHQHARALRAAVDAATTAQEVDAVVW